jgi:hypothetical protein
VPRGDGVALDLSVENLGDRALYDIAMPFCVITFEDPDLADREFRRTWLHTSGVFVHLAGKTAYNVAGALTGGCCVAGMRTGPEIADDGVVFLRATRGAPSVALGMDRTNVIFANAVNAYIHADPLFGQIQPGETKHARSQLFISGKSLDEVLAAYRARFR